MVDLPMRVGPWQIIPNDSPIILVPKFQPIILSNQPTILSYSQSVTENIMHLTITKNGTCINSLFIIVIIVIASLQTVEYTVF